VQGGEEEGGKRGWRKRKGRGGKVFSAEEGKHKGEEGGGRERRNRAIPREETEGFVSSGRTGRRIRGS
jgi:hypothetical protein